MTTEFLSSVDREKSPLLGADFDAVRIAAALLNSPRILTARAEPGDDIVRFTTQDATQYTLSLQSADPADDDVLRVAVLTEALASAIPNSPHFVVATADSPRKDTITVQTCDQTRYLLGLDADHHPDAGGHEVSTSEPRRSPDTSSLPLDTAAAWPR